MGLLPDIGPGGELELSKHEKKQFSDRRKFMQRRAKFAKVMDIIKAKHEAKELKKMDSELSKLNNMGHNKVTEDFSDSPHADR